MSEYKVLTDVEHTLKRSMYSGSFERIVHKLACDESNNVYKTKDMVSPCLYNLLNESITNCCDHVLNDDNKVTNINVNIDNKGICTIYNNGKGITHDKIDGIHTPEVIFTRFRSGSNFDDSDDGRDTGGCNGIGIKLTVVHSNNFEIQTVYNKKLYTQKYSTNLDTKKIDIEPPVLEKYSSSIKKSYTKLTFTPNYQRFGYTTNDLKEFIDVIRYRCVLAQIFLKFKKVKVEFNNVDLSTITMHDLLDDSNNTFILSSKYEDKFLEYIIAVRTGKFVHTSCINGLVVPDGGTHLTYLIRLINNKIKEISAGRSVDDKRIEYKNYLCVVSKAWLNIKNWGTQTKDKLEVSETYFKNFTLNPLIITKIAKQILELTKVFDIKKIINQKIDRKQIIDKYLPAQNVNNKKESSTLIVAEGDSALSLIHQGLKSNASFYTPKNTGTFSLGGVPTNVAKGITEDVDEEGDNIYLATEKFYRSKIFGALIKILKIDSGKKYKTVDELKTLSYDKLLIAVDADTDGIGNICPLVIQVFYRLWPNLLQHKYIHVWNSPILRVDTGKSIKEFKFQQEFDKWSKDHIGNYKISYIKGLAGHDNKYIKKMFTNFEKDLVCMKIGKDTKEKFDTYFGPDASRRKVELATSVVDFTDEEIHNFNTKNEILCDRHLDKHTKEHQQYASRRSIPSCIDGLTIVRRQILETMILENIVKERKINEIGGIVSYLMSYHHGDISMNGACIKMTQDYLGSNMYPLLIGAGQVGTRNRRGADAGAARYVKAYIDRKLMDMIFPKEYRPELEKKYVDGKEVEPKYYIPLIPLSILEYHQNVSYGWSLHNYPRDLKSICDIMMDMCTDEAPSFVDIPLSNHKFKGKLSLDNRICNMTGCYTINKDTIHITELPINVKPNDIALSLAENDNVLDIRNCSANNVDIIIELKPGFIKTIDVEKYFNIKSSFKEHLHFINENEVIEEFDTAYDIVFKVFNLNKKMIGIKINRELLLLKYLIIREENIIKFIENDIIDLLKNKSDVETDHILCKEKIHKVNSSLLNTANEYTLDQLIVLLDTNMKFDYIKQIRVHDVSNTELIKRNKRLKEYIDRKKYLEKMLKEKPFPGSSEYKTNIKNIYDKLSISGPGQL